MIAKQARSQRLPALAGVALTAVMVAWAAPRAVAADYTVGELLNSCKEGDSASREAGQYELMVCNQYMLGFVHAYVAIGGKGYCFPSGDGRVDDMRRAFLKWSVNKSDTHGWNASDGVLAAMACP